MTSRNGWLRVSRSRPCAICERPDWCLIATDGGAAICARIESQRRIGEAGWLHRLRDGPWRPNRHFVRSVTVGSATPAHPDLSAMAAACRSELRPDGLQQLASDLGLSPASLTQLGIGWSSQFRAWTFPMVDAGSNVLGIRLRRPNGFKFSVPGCKDGLFIPKESETDDSPLLIAEGATDVAALWDMGFRALAGRPSCTGGIKLLCELVRRRRRPEVVIIADGDTPGQRGAENLASVVMAYSPGVKVITPPDGIKDARTWLQLGWTRQDVQQAIEKAPVGRLLLCGRASAAGNGR
jgi:hypothetical protein